ncbi:hypothetical protein KDA_59790 [Dictyobacter alpinus]|uniref:CopC domain-containing protein n=2 Tax=Dictyobacter alpinus TaxID=2014873 RepID=A0A402BGJ2_9CHLR|nr:hypothetical protein KDA_59790 [Dictyobacter alpinus]
MLQPASVLAAALHATLIRADPAEGSLSKTSVTTVRLLFSEPVQPLGQTITLLSPTGQQSAHGAVKITGNQVEMSIDVHQPGSYLVNWQVLSQDSQPVNGSYIFSLQRVAGPWANTTAQDQPGGLSAVLQTLAHVIHFVGYALAFGVLAFLWLVVGSLDTPDDDIIEQRLFRLVHIGILALLLAEPLNLLAQALALTNGQGLNLDSIGGLLATSFGWLFSLRLGAALLLWSVVGAIQQGAKRGIQFACGLGIVLALIDSIGSHALGSSSLWLSLLAHIGHLVGMGLWLGGLSGLIVLWNVQALSSQRTALLLRFGHLSATAVAELFISGILLSWLHVARLANLFTTFYGRIVLTKICLFLLILSTIVVLMRAKKYSSRDWWIIEAIALTGVLILAGLLISLSPPLPQN